MKKERNIREVVVVGLNPKDPELKAFKKHPGFYAGKLNEVLEQIQDYPELECRHIVALTGLIDSPSGKKVQTFARNRKIPVHIVPDVKAAAKVVKTHLSAYNPKKPPKPVDPKKLAEKIKQQKRDEIADNLKRVHDAMSGKTGKTDILSFYRVGSSLHR